MFDLICIYGWILLCVFVFEVYLFGKYDDIGNVENIYVVWEGGYWLKVLGYYW